MSMQMHQEAPYPIILQELVEGLAYKAGYVFTLEDIDRGQGCNGLTLCIRVSGPNSDGSGTPINVMHYMPVPAAAYNRDSWQAWLFEQIELVDRHERGEFFLMYGQQPFAPKHEDGNNPHR